ncbi:hypothetical protein PRUPE_4G214400 [Prunus persica]|uniref:Uncharacterized protein n=1 Tax=Prunus persica TaxID=3760 RepID=A0A251PP11_PRUPE|nr:hypothetical protein PRUPE_4G214400 [Prunus persica]
MRECKLLSFAIVLVLFLVNGVNGKDPYRFFTWKITYGDIYPLRVQRGWKEGAGCQGSERLLQEKKDFPIMDNSLFAILSQHVEIRC